MRFVDEGNITVDLVFFKPSVRNLKAHANRRQYYGSKKRPPTRTAIPSYGAVVSFAWIF